MATVSLATGLGCASLSFCFFVICRYLCQLFVYFPEKSTKTSPRKSRPYIRTCFTSENYDQWERLNLIISFLHSLITGVATIYSFWAYSPAIYQDFVNHINLVTYSTCSLSFGKEIYFKNKD